MVLEICAGVLLICFCWPILRLTNEVVRILRGSPTLPTPFAKVCVGVTELLMAKAQIVRERMKREKEQAKTFERLQSVEAPPSPIQVSKMMDAAASKDELEMQVTPPGYPVGDDPAGGFTFSHEMKDLS